MRRVAMVVVSIAALLTTTRGPSAQAAGGPAGPRYSVTGLGTAGGASEAFAVNDTGQVAGRYATGSGYQAFLWKDGVMQGLGTLGGDSSEAYGINDDEQVVGTS